MAKYKFSEIELKELDGKVIEGADVHKSLANIIYRNASSLDLVEIAREINAGAEVPLTSSQINEIKRTIADPKAGMFAFARKAIVDYIDEVQRVEREEKKKKPEDK